MLNYGGQSVLERGAYVGIMPGEISLLYEISGILNSKNDKQVVLREVLQKMNEHMGMLRGEIFILDTAGEKVLLKESFNDNDDHKQLHSDRVEEGVKNVAETGRPAAFSELEPGAELVSEGTLLSAGSKDKFLLFMVPILVEEQVRGVLSVDRFFGSGLSVEQTLMLISTISSMIAASINFDELLIYKSFRFEFPQDPPALPSDNLEDTFVLDRSFMIKGGSSEERGSFSREIHESSSRCNRPFMSCDCTQLGTDFAEMEIFGRQKSAFLGGLSSRQGLLEKAEGGTLFLDNVHCLSLLVQVRLFKFLEERKYYSIGSSEVKYSDVRLICGTDRDLRDDSESGSFNQGLYSLLDRYSLDIRSASGIMKNECRSEYRELSYMKESNVEIDRKQVDNFKTGGTLQESLDALEYDLIVKRLQQTKGNVSKTAEELGLTQRILGLRLKKYNIDFRNYRKNAG